MSSSLLGTGNAATIPITATSIAPATLYDRDGVYGAADGHAPTAYLVTNGDATNWLYVQVPAYTGSKGLQSAGQGVPLMPGQGATFVLGANNLGAVLAWATTPAVGGSAATCVVLGGIQEEV